MWADPPWVRDGRPPSLDELIPHTDVEVDRHAADVRRAMADLLDGRTFAGLSVRLDLTDPNSVSVYRDSVVVRLDVLDRDAGMMVGSTVRSFGRDHDGSLYVEHVSLRLNQQAQGGGFAREWNRFLEDWYRYSGVDHIEVHASSTVGGYAWARAGYDWAPNTEHRANAVLQRLAMQMRQVDNHIADVGRWAAGDSSVDIGALQRRYGAEHPDDLVARMRDEYAAGQDILERARRHPFGSAGYPSPEDVSHAGWDGRTGREAMWIGKEALLGADWKGVKPISETGPLHPRPAGPEITAAAVPESLFHGFARDEPAPDVVSALGHTALASRMSALPPDSALAGVRIELTTVDAHTLPDGAVARSVPVEGGYTIQLSDRASDAAVPRAVAHEIAELTAIRARAAGGLDVSVPDALHPGPHADGAPLSPHDLGRLAEVDQLVPLLADPAHAPHARAELAALRDHLGLRADDPGAAGRRELVDPYVRGAGHDPDTLWGDPAPDPDPRARVDATVDPVSGYELRQRDLDFIGRSEQDLAWLADREAPLGMTPEVYHDWSASLYDALRRDGITPDAVDVRIRGSSVDVYSGRHKVLPTAADLAADPDAAARLQAWLGDDPDRPTSRPFDSMHRLGLEEPSDYDINISSDRMFDQVAARWDADGADGPLRTDHGYLPKRLVRAEFPHVAAWAREWSASLGRDMSYAVFDGHGPRDSTQFGFFVHFHDADFVVRPPETGPAISGPATGGPARPVAPDDTAYRDWSRQESDRIVTDDGRVTTSEAAKTRVIRSVADRMTTPLPRLLAAAAEPHVDPRLAGLLGSPDHVVVLRNPDYPSMGGTLVARDALDPSVPADRLLALDDPAAPRIVREMAVSELIMAWAHDSNGTNVRSLAIQEAAVAEFGLRGHLGWPMSPEVRADVDAAVAAHGDVHRELLRAQYDLTQAELRQRGVNELALYRGYAWDPAQVPDWATVPAGEVVDLPPQRPLSAWTGDRQIAEDWIGSLSRPGVVIAARFPAEAVLAYPQTGVGCLWQREFVVLAGDGRAIMDVVYPGRR